jgi:hypothetical protein
MWIIKASQYADPNHPFAKPRIEEIDTNTAMGALAIMEAKMHNLFGYDWLRYAQFISVEKK